MRGRSRRIETELIGGIGNRELALLGDYLTSCRHTGGYPAGRDVLPPPDVPDDSIVTVTEHADHPVEQ